MRKSGKCELKMNFSISKDAYLVLLLLFFFQLSGGVIKFTLEPPNPSYARNGSNAKLVWNYSVDNQQAELEGIRYSVESGQRFVEMLVVQSDGTVINHPNIPAAYSGRVRIEGRASLVIEDINRQDNTQFMCTLVAKSGAGRDVEGIVQLIVTVAPEVSISSVQGGYNEGSFVNISCSASGMPPSDIQWIRNGNVESSGKSLMFSRINRTDDGKYTCKANNSAGNDEKHVTLVVHYKPEGTTLNTTAADNTITQGGTVTFTCRVTAAKPQVSRYRFYLNDTTLAKDSNDSQYVINKVQRSQHYGKYKCIPSNDVGDGPEATVILKVNVPVQFTVFPQNVTVNETNPVVLSCDASGFPEPSLSWTKEGIELSQSEQLSIQSAKSDTGMYVCTASNGIGQDKTAQAYVTVQYPPSIKEPTLSTAKSWIGQTVTLKCVSDGIPTPTLAWSKPDGSQINSITFTQNTVNVIMSVDQDFGDYKCVADNGLTPADSKIVKIEQIKKPGSPTIAQLDIQATSLKVKWTATDDGGSPITAYQVVILKDGAEIKNFNITDPDATSLNAGGLERNTTYIVRVLARNAVFEGPAAEEEVTTKYEGVPEAATIDPLPNEVTGDTITLKWSEPQNNGKEITNYTVYQRVVTDGKPGEWIKLKIITNKSVKEFTVDLTKGKVYEFVVTATNDFGESLKEEEKVRRVKASENLKGDDGTQTGDGDDGNGMGAAIYAGAAAAGVLLIIGIIVIIVLWRRRKPSSDEETSRDELGSANPYEVEDGYHSSSREAAQSLQASGPAAEPNYALVDQSKKKKNRMPANDEYAQVDKSKKAKKKKKKPGELDYADLEDLRADIQLGPVPSGGAAAATPIVRPPAYEGTEYADISQFGVPRPDPTYANVPKQEVVYSNVESM